MDFLKKYTTFIVASIALVLSGCNTFNDVRPLPDVYANSENVAEHTLTTLKTFGAAQDTYLTVCTPAVAGTVEGDACVVLGTAEQTLRPAVTVVGQIAAEYVDIDKRIRELGPNAPAEWLLAAAEVAGRLSVVYDPIKSDVDNFIANAGKLTN